MNVRLQNHKNHHSPADSSVPTLIDDRLLRTVEEPLRGARVRVLCDDSDRVRRVDGGGVARRAQVRACACVCAYTWPVGL